MLAAALTACTPVALPELPRQDLPAQWRTDAAYPAAPPVDPRSWWTHFHDPALDALVTQALTGNLGLAQARLRIERARLLLGHSNDDLLPAVTARARTVSTEDTRNNFFQYGLDATWELGLFGRDDSVRRVAQATLDAADADLVAVRVSVVAEVVRSYVELRARQQQGLALDEQERVLQEQLQLVGVRKQLQLPALTAELALQDQLAQVRSSRLQTHQQIDEAAQRLALLLGTSQPDPQWLQPAALPQLAPFASDRLPTELLRSRPDVRAAEAAVLRGAGELGIAQADLYPHVSLGSSYFFANDITRRTNLSNPTHSTLGIGPAFDIPLFDWGQRRAALQASQSALDETLLAYREAVLTAVNEGEGALASLEWQRQLVAHANEKQTQVQQQATREQARATAGFASRLDLLAAEGRSLDARLALIDAQAAHDLAFIALFKALGGSSLPADKAD